jgi:serine/threonine-protein kinase
VVDVEADPARCERCSAELASDALFCPMCGAPRAKRDGGDPLLGSVIADRYLLVERLGHGNSGNIYLAEHVTLRRRFAVKLLHHELSGDDLAVERFRREATTVGQIDNEHIVEVHDFGRAGDGRLFTAMEYMQGEPLSAMIERDKQLPVAKVVDVLIQVGEALMEAHAMGFVHRDLRPRNIFLMTKRGREGFVKLLDFGLAKLVEKEGDAASTSLGMTFGDPRYMAPEQAQGEGFDRRADIYSLGVIAYEMLVGRPPFVGEKVFDVLTRHLEDPVPRPSADRKDVPPWLDSIVVRMLAKQPVDRFVTVYRIVEALRDGQGSGRIMSDDAARSMPAQTPPPPAPRPRRETGLLPEKAIRMEAASMAASSPNDTGKWFAEGDALPERPSGSLPIGDQSRYIRMEDKRRDRRSFFIAGGIVAAIGAMLLVMAVWPSAKKKREAQAAAAAATQPAADPAPAPVPVAAPVPAPAPAPAPVAAPPPDSPPAPASPPDAAPAKVVAPPQPSRLPKRDPATPRRVPPPREPPPLPPRDPPPPKDPPPANADAAQAEFFVKLGQKALREGDVVAAAANFNKARGFNARNPEAIAGLGEVALQQGYYRESIVHLSAASRLAPRSPRIQTLLGQAYLGNDQPKLAAAAFKRALKLQPDNDQARRGYEEAERRMK